MFCLCSSSQTDSPRRPRIADTNDLTDIRNPQPPGQAAPDESNNWRQQLMNREAGVTLALDLAISNMSNNEGGASSGIRKLKKLGQGGFGEVWLATADEGQTKVAVKELNEPFMFTPGSEDIKDKLKQLPFFSEAAIQALLVHKNIVRTNGAHVNFVDPATNKPLRIRDLAGGSMSRADSVASIGSTEWTQIDNKMINELNLPSQVSINVRIVMEFCEFGSLFDYLRPRLPPELQHHQPNKVPLHIAIGGNMEQTLCAMMTALDVARGLRLLHRCRVVHGDLKPHNILLAKDEEDPRGFVAKLSDFGLSGHLAKGANAIGGITHGSPPYMSPESLKDREVTPRSDIYALGVIMWELWHNEQWSSIYEPYRKMYNLKYTDMADFKPKCHPTCPAEYSAIVERCLEAEPTARPRPQDVSHLLENCIFERQAAMQA